jgi:phytanoyl-CoA hydroxylase
MSAALENRQENIAEQYEAEGYVILRNVIDADLVRETDEFVDWLLRKHPGTRPEDLHSYVMRDEPFLLRLVGDDRLLDVAEQFIGPHIALYGAHFICKPPRDGKAVAWHQDGSYWPLDPMEVTTLWLAVTESTPENGCMRIIPGTQHLSLQEMDERHRIEGAMLSGMDQALADESRAVDLVLNPGDVSVHNPNLIHGSNANTSDRWRRGLTIRYIPTSTRVTREGVGSQFLLRGEAVAGVNSYLSRPKFRDGETMPFRGAEAYS